jgi:capsular polysaccharide transport system permease protein
VSLLAGVDRQLNVVFTLALRETRARFGGSRIGFLWAFLEPLLWIFSLYLVFAIAERESPRGMTLFAFLTTGLVTFQLFTKVNDQVAEAINANRSLLFYPQVHPLDVTFARGALEGATYVTVFAVLMVIDAVVSGQGLVVDNPLTVIVGLLLTTLLAYALGLVFCMAQVTSDTVKRIRGPILRPLFWISGIFFTANSLPLSARELLMINPLMHCIELVRDGWFGSYQSRHASASYVVAWIICLLFAGLTLERMVRSRVELS